MRAQFEGLKRTKHPVLDPQPQPLALLGTDTGRLVGTGSDNPAAAKLAILKAVKIIQKEAGVSIAIRRFSVINQVHRDTCIQHPPNIPISTDTPSLAQVGAATLGASLDLDGFSAAHRDSANFDRSLFVGLPWRAPHEACCAEIYSTGKMNLPGSRRSRDLLKSYSQMAPEMLRMSDNPELINMFPKHLHEIHRPRERAEKTQAEKQAESARMWKDDDDDDDAAVVNRLETARRRMQLVDGGGSTGVNKKRHQKGGFVALGARGKKSKVAEMEEDGGAKDDDAGGDAEADVGDMGDMGDMGGMGGMGGMGDIGAFGESIFGDLFG